MSLRWKTNSGLDVITDERVEDWEFAMAVEPDNSGPLEQMQTLAQSQNLMDSLAKAFLPKIREFMTVRIVHGLGYPHMEVQARLRFIADSDSDKVLLDEIPGWRKRVPKPENPNKIKL